MTADPLAEGAFPGFTEEKWRALAGKSTGGRPVDSLAWQSDDGIAVGPIYPRAGGDAEPLPMRPAGPWTIVQRVDADSPSPVETTIRRAADGGAGAIELVLEGSPVARGRGLVLDDDAVLRIARTLPTGLGLVIAGGPRAPHLLGRIVERGSPPCPISAAFDPFAAMAAFGSLPGPLDAGRSAVVDASRLLADAGVPGSTMLADGRPWNDGGASEAQELAIVVSGAVAWLRIAEEAGMELEDAAGRIAVALAADADQFLTIARFRAVRLLVARVFEAAGLAARTCPVHAETAWRMMTPEIPHMNMLRATTAALAAGAGGADSVTVLPFAAGPQAGLANRMARNTQSILIEEAGIAAVGDPGAGSGAIEALTAALAEAAWEIFRGIEAEGGLAAAVGSGSIERAVAGMRDARLGRSAGEPD